MGVEVFFKLLILNLKEQEFGRQADLSNSYIEDAMLYKKI